MCSMHVNDSMIEIKTKKKGHLHFVCSSEFDHLDAIVDQTEVFLAPLIADDELSYKVVLLLTEAVTNAIEHGNAMDTQKRVTGDLLVQNKQIQITVEDEGEGFERQTVKDPTKEENLLMDGGRGIFFIEQMADRVEYEMQGRRVHIFFDR